MRNPAPALSVLFALLPAALHAEGAMCEYHNPSHPGWDFFAACEVEITTEGVRTTRTAKVSNGSRFTTVTEDGETTVNGHAALSVMADEADCWRTDTERELICIHPAGSLAPVASAPATAPDDPEAAMGLAGGEAGYCLLSRGGKAEAYGPCNRRENCVEMDAESGMTGVSCLTSYNWSDGRETETARTKNWQTLDGAPAASAGKGCLTDDGADITFCYSTAAMTAARQPALAGFTPEKRPQ